MDNVVKRTKKLTTCTFYRILNFYICYQYIRTCTVIYMESIFFVVFLKCYIGFKE